MELSNARLLAEELIKKYCDNKFDDKTYSLFLCKFAGFVSSKRRFGFCRYKVQKMTLLKEKVNMASIYLSEPLVKLNDESEVRNVILHEIAHALTPGHHHDYVWRNKCREIGARPERCYDGEKINMPEPLYLMVCEKDHIAKKYYKKPSEIIISRINRELYSCNYCSKTFNKKHLVKIVKNNNFKYNKKLNNMEEE